MSGQFESQYGDSFRVRQPGRRTSGILGTILLPLTIIVVSLLAILAVDVGHITTVQGELQNSADAGALSGARALISSQSSSQAESDALSVTGANTADGRAVASSSWGTSVTAQAQDINGAQPGVVEVQAQMTINNIFAKLINCFTNNLNVSSTSLAYPSVSGVGQNSLFPLAVSIDTTAGHIVPLYQSKVGDTVTFYINSQQYKNATYTGFTGNNANADYINSAIDQALGITSPQPGFVPAENIGDSISLMNGVAGTKDLSSGQENAALTDGRTLILPLIAGAAPFNQDRPIVGFIGVQVNNVQADQSGGKVEILTCTITKAIVKGTPGAVGTPTGNSNIDAAIQNLSPGMVMLGNQQLNNTTGDTAQAVAPSPTGTPTSIVSNFNGTPINSGAIWFNSVLAVKNVAKGANSTVYFTNQTVTFTANGTPVNVPIPDSKILYSPSATTAATTWDATANRWETILPSSYNGNVFQSGVPYQVGTAGLPGGINPVTWSGQCSTDTPGLTLQWQWAAAVYTALPTDNSTVGPKPVDDNKLSQYKNSDHAGCPENCLSNMGTGGARGGGGSNYTGSYSSTASVTPAVTVATQPGS